MFRSKSLVLIFLSAVLLLLLGTLVTHAAPVSPVNQPRVSSAAPTGTSSWITIACKFSDVSAAPRTIAPNPSGRIRTDWPGHRQADPAAVVARQAAAGALISRPWIKLVCATACARYGLLSK